MKEVIKHNFDETIIRSYDVRGVYKETLFNNDARILGNVFGLKVGENKTVNVGYDGRKSSIQLKDNLIDGLLESGVNVNDIGLVPTPLLYFSCIHCNADGGVMVTGSHNPKNHNGFKIVLNNLPFYGVDLIKIKNKAKSFSLPKNNGKKKTIDLRETYLKRLFKDLIQKRKINIVWDSGNGASGEIVKMISKRICGTQKVLFDKIDGDFPNHHPDPSEPKNLEFCRNEILKNGFDVGIAFDGDGDRIGVVDNKGRIISGDNLLLIFAKQLLKKKKSLIIGDVKCSKVFFDQVKKLGGRTIMSKTGHSHVKTNMKKFSADLAGEMSGHIFFSYGYYGFDDALYASIQLIDILTNEDKTLSDLVDEIPKVFNTPEIRIDCDDRTKFEIIKKIIKKQKSLKKKIVDIDGARVSFDDGWWLLRASNTQPALVLRCEALSEDGLTNQINEVKSQLKEIDSTLAEKILA